jgi:hypothetical protein
MNDAAIQVTGELTARVFRGEKLVQSMTRKNLVVDAGLAILANRLADATPDSDCLVTYVAVGTGTDAPAAGNTTLQTETKRKAVASRANSGGIAAISTVFAAGEVPTSTLKEVGLFVGGTIAADSGTLFARQNIDVAVTALDSVFIDWRITLAAA